MKRLLFSLILLISAQLANANHVIGGQIYWDAVGQERYVFHLDVLTECLGPGFPSWANVSTSVGTTIRLNMTGDTTLSSSCLTCITGTEPRAIHYQSDTIQFIFPTNASKVDFSYDGSGRGASVNLFGQPSIQIISQLFIYGVNRSSVRYELTDMFAGLDGSELFLKLLNPQADSTEFVHLPSRNINSTGQLVDCAYDSGFTYMHPVSPLDVLDPAGHFDGKTQLTGDYFVVIGADQYTSGGLLAASICLETRMKVITPSSNNNPVDSVIVLSGNWVNSNSIGYNVTAQPGDSLNLQILAQDWDVNPNFQAQVITASIVGDIASGTSGLSFQPSAPQSSLSEPYVNITDFIWNIPSNMKSGTYRFVVSFMDDVCPNPGYTSVPISVRIPGVSVTRDTFFICVGGQTRLIAPAGGTRYHWSPSNGLSDTASSVITANPAVTTTYTLNVDNRVVAEYTVRVINGIIPQVAVPQVNSVQITNPTDFQEHAFHYGYVPVSFDDGTFTTNASGLYQVVGRNMDCFSASGDVQVGTDSLNAYYMLNRYRPWDQFVWMRPTVDSLKINMRIGSEYKHIWVREIILPGVQPVGGAASLQLVLKGNGGYSDTLTGSDLDGHSVEFILPTRESFSLVGEFELIVQSDSARIPIYRDLALPYSYGYYFATLTRGNIGGEAMYNDVIPFFVKGDVYLSSPEVDRESLLVYPQPADDILTISGDLLESSGYELYDMSGKKVASGFIGEDGVVNVALLAPGVYILNVDFKEGKEYTQKVLIY